MFKHDVTVLLCESSPWSAQNTLPNAKYTFTEMTDTHIMFGHTFGVKVAHIITRTALSPGS